MQSPKENYKKTRMLVLISVLVAQGMILGFIEKMLPLPFIVPGAKLGLANIITLTSIYILSFKQSFSVVFLRVILTAVTFGSMSSFLYSLSGGILSLLAMAGLFAFFKERINLITVSIIGAVAHNLGQLLVASLILESVFILTYLPILMVIAIPTGVFVGIVARFLINYLKKTHFV
jgi:heptaprenyl diphosphate synthase